DRRLLPDGHHLHRCADGAERVPRRRRRAVDLPLRPGEEDPEGPRHRRGHRSGPQPDDPPHPGPGAGVARVQRLQRLLVLRPAHGGGAAARPACRAPAPSAGLGSLRPGAPCGGGGRGQGPLLSVREVVGRGVRGTGRELTCSSPGPALLHPPMPQAARQTAPSPAPEPESTGVLELTAADARAFLVRRHFLSPPRALPARAESVLRVVRELGSVQFDPLEVTGARNDDLVLASRIRNYRRAWMERWLYGPPEERQLFEAYNKSLNILPIE